jgi:ribosome recycling factor
MEKSVGAFCSGANASPRYNNLPIALRNQGLPTMNTFERRRLVKAQVIDVKVAKAAVSTSRRQRAEAAKALRKDMAARHFESLRAAS